MGVFTAERTGQAILQRPALAREHAGHYIALPVAEGPVRDVLMWEVAKPGVVLRGRMPDRLPVELGAAHARLLFHDREVAEDFAAMLNLGRQARGLSVPQPPPARPWWDFFGWTSRA